LPAFSLTFDVFIKKPSFPDIFLSISREMTKNGIWRKKTDTGLLAVGFWLLAYGF
jgi:hypothetical protein